LKKVHSNINEEIKERFFSKHPSPSMNFQPFEGSPKKPFPFKDEMSYNFLGGRKDSKNGREEKL
jgi:hypothetical protein